MVQQQGGARVNRLGSSHAVSADTTDTFKKRLDKLMASEDRLKQADRSCLVYRSRYVVVLLLVSKDNKTAR